MMTISMHARLVAVALLLLAAGCARPSNAPVDPAAIPPDASVTRAISSREPAPPPARDAPSADTPSPLMAAYLSVPAEYLIFDQCDAASTEDRECMVYRAHYLTLRGGPVDDRANGYFRIDGENVDPTIELALFRRTDGTSVVAVYTGQTLFDRTSFLERGRDGAWIDVSNTLVPDYSNTTRRYALPRQGTRITVRAKSLAEPDGVVEDVHDTLYELVWADDRFSIVQ